MPRFDEIRRICRRERPLARAAMAVIFVSAVIYGGAKPPSRSSPRRGDGAHEQSAFSDAEQSLGFVCVTNPAAAAGLWLRAGIPSGNTLAVAPSNAEAKASWLATGVFDDYFTMTPPTNAPVRIGTNDVRRIMVFSHGNVKAVLENDEAAYLAPFRAPMSFIAQNKWAECGVTSRCWTASSPASTVVSWENALLGRDTARPLSFQIEFLANGDFIYRYGDTGSIDALTNATFTIGALAPQPGQELASITGTIARASSLYFAGIAAYGDGTGDADGDGLLDGDEIMLYGTDPRESDTDGDGMSDYDEIAQGLNPHSPDSDGDGVPDGWTADGIATNRLFSCEGDTIAATLHLCGDVATNANAVLLVGDLPLLLSSPRTWDLFIPRGEQFSLRLSYGGAVKPELALEAGPGIWIEGARDIFAETAPMGGLRLNSRDGVASQMRAAPARGGYGGHAVPSISGIKMEFNQYVHLLHREASSTVSLSVTPSGRVSAGDVAYEFKATGVLRHEPVRVVSPESDWVWSILHPYSPIDCGKGFSLRAKIYDTQGQEVLAESSFTRCPLRNGISTRLVGGSETDGFSPHLGEALAVGVPAYCACPLQVSQNMLYGFDVEVEAAREPNTENHAGRQHIAWFDGDEDRSGVQRRIEIEDDRLGVPFIWDGVATSGAAEIQAAEIFDTGSAQYHRILPQVVSGEPVPPPYIDAIVRVFEHGENSETEGEWILRVYVPQVAKVTWDTSIVSALQNDIHARDLNAGTNIFFMAGISASYAGELMGSLPGAIAERFPLTTNIRIVGESETITGRHKKIRIVDQCASGDSMVLGLSPTELCSFMNADPHGECFVYFPAFTNGLRIAYEKYINEKGQGFNYGLNDWEGIPTPILMSMVPQFLAEVSVHELCHTLGLVSEQHLGGVRNGHNNCTDGLHVMDSGDHVYWVMRIRSSNLFLFKSLNRHYLNFILPGGGR